jgi:beta-phosphoglucomutase-like phosphatase (HAD superfamily)
MAEPREIRAIIFDLDGTLVDSAEDLRAALNEVLGGLGLRAIRSDEIHGMIGDGVPKLIERGLAAVGGDPCQISCGYHHRPPASFGADRLIDRFEELLSFVRVSPAGSDASLLTVNRPVHSRLTVPEPLQ